MQRYQMLHHTLQIKFYDYIIPFSACQIFKTRIRMYVLEKKFLEILYNCKIPLYQIIISLHTHTHTIPKQFSPTDKKESNKKSIIFHSPEITNPHTYTHSLLVR